MGKRIISQRRGRGGPKYRAPSHRYLADVKLPAVKAGEGVVVKLTHDPGHTAPLAKVRVGDKYFYMIAPEGLAVGEKIYIGTNAPIKPGNILPISSIPEGTPIYNLELNPFDGGKVARAGGTMAMVVSHGEKVVVQLPSGQFRALSRDCRAIVGVVAGSGRKDLPVAKAGKKHHMLSSKARVWPKTSGVAMNPVNHPHGGGSHQHVGRPNTISRNAPPGRKVGRLSPKKKSKKKSLKR
ncbi:MAG: 50S ribosomal protein L2 [Thermoplasmata archaeon]|nr:MAG: 50S ribosomal protein L2 [Thermoplasmata archaeon]HDD59887.1 50S ribosomal protein L2 [Euryarchaeota archaeon]RLF71189.1 MAG: 50S ribosomal protein L2 [Thermoplasmata archaeon]RLF72252.1 MAG: 50S ribosomal protein L2 [Thermoplasmata archaeon]RLF74394.1 MAG: 50S ribosomal protein L2 [Thermoplasmata archaeon]